MTDTERSEFIREINELCKYSKKSIDKEFKHDNRRNIEQSKRCYKQFRNQTSFRRK